MNTCTFPGALSLVICTLTAAAHAGVTEYTSFASWQAASPTYSTITFGEVPVGTLVTDQYASLGVLFTDFDPNVAVGPSASLFPQDTFGLVGETLIELTLDQPGYGVAAHFPGGTRYRLYSGSTLLYQSSYFGGSGTGFFSGLISTVAFDRVQIEDEIMTNDKVALDNLYFSFAPVPGPGGAAVLLFLGCAGGRRRRRV